MVLFSVFSVIGGYRWSNTVLEYRVKKLKMSTESDNYVPSRFKSHLEFGWDVSQKRFAIVSWDKIMAWIIISLAYSSKDIFSEVILKTQFIIWCIWVSTIWFFNFKWYGEGIHYLKLYVQIYQMRTKWRYARTFFKKELEVLFKKNLDIFQAKLLL